MELLQPVDVAVLLGVPISTLANWRCAGHGPPYLRVGKYVRYRLADVEAWIASRVRDPEGVTPAR
jgi:predicted DNA-binding transcriptional regulator AlpA